MFHECGVQADQGLAQDLSGQLLGRGQTDSGLQHLRKERSLT